ncbi:MAG: condensation domain-containing protein, partial [Mycobacterium sp.]
MVTRGSLQSWQRVSGEVFTWTATPASKAAMARAQHNPLPPSFQQATHLRAAFYGNEMGRPMPRLIVASWDIPGVCDVAAMSEAINAHVRRHDTYHSAFEFAHGDIVRRTIDDPQTIEMAPEPYGYLSTEQIRAHVPATTPGT